MLKTKRLIKVTGVISRGVLAMLTVVAIATLWLWSARPLAIDQLDKALFLAHNGRYISEFNEAITLLGESRADAAEGIFAGLIDNLGEVRKGDRLEKIYADSVKALIAIKNEKDDINGTASLTEKLVMLDPNYYRYWLKHATLLERRGDRSGAIDAYKRAFVIAPHFLETTVPLADALYSDNRADEAKGVVDEYLAANRGGSIGLYANGMNEPLVILHPVSFSPGTRRFSFPISENAPRHQSTFIIGFDHMTDMILKASSIDFVTPDGRVNGRLKFMGVGVFDLAEIAPFTFFKIGPKPAIYFQLPRALSRSEISSVELEVEFQPAVPPDLKQLTAER